MKTNIVFNTVLVNRKPQNFYYLITLTHRHRCFGQIELRNLLPKDSIFIKEPTDSDPYLIIRTDNIENVKQGIFVKSIDLLLYSENKVLLDPIKSDLEKNKNENFNDILSGPGSNFSSNIVRNIDDSEKSKDLNTKYSNNFSSNSGISKELYTIRSGFYNNSEITNPLTTCSNVPFFELGLNFNLSNNLRPGNSSKAPEIQCEKNRFGSLCGTNHISDISLTRPESKINPTCSSMNIYLTELKLNEILKNIEFIANVRKLLLYHHNTLEDLTYSGKITTFQCEYLERKFFFDSLGNIIFGDTDLSNSKISYKLVVTQQYAYLVMNPNNQSLSFRKTILKLRIPERLFIGRTCMDPEISTFMFNMVRFNPEKTMTRPCSDQNNLNCDKIQKENKKSTFSSSVVDVQALSDCEKNRIQIFVQNESEISCPNVRTQASSEYENRGTQTTYKTETEIFKHLIYRKWPVNEVAHLLQQFALENSRFISKDAHLQHKSDLPGDKSQTIKLVFDPFCGSGGLLLIPALLDHFVIGSDIKKDEMIGKLRYNSEKCLDDRQKQLVEQFINIKWDNQENKTIQTHDYTKLYRIVKRNEQCSILNVFESSSNAQLKENMSSSYQNSHEKGDNNINEDSPIDEFSNQTKIPKKTERIIEPQQIICDEKALYDHQMKQEQRDNANTQLLHSKPSSLNIFVKDETPLHQNKSDVMTKKLTVKSTVGCILHEIQHKDGITNIQCSSNHHLEKQRSNCSDNSANTDGNCASKHFHILDILPKNLKIPIPRPLLFIQNLPGTRTTLCNTSLLSNFYQYNCGHMVLGIYEEDIKDIGEVLSGLARSGTEKYAILETIENKNTILKKTALKPSDIHLSIITDMPYGHRIPLKTETQILTHLYSLAKQLLMSSERICFCIKKGRYNEILKLFKEFTLICTVTQKLHKYEREFFCFQKK